MVSPPRNTSGDNVPPPSREDHPLAHTHLPPPGTNIPFVGQNVNQAGSSAQAPPTFTLTWEQLQYLISSSQRQIMDGSGAQNAPAAAVPALLPPPPLQENRPAPLTPALPRQAGRRREGPMDSTAQSPHESRERALNEGFAPPRENQTTIPGSSRRHLRFQDQEEVAESLVHEGHGLPGNRHGENREVTRAPPHRSQNARPELEEVSQQIQRLSKQVEDLARRDRDRPPARETRGRNVEARDHELGVEVGPRMRRERESPFCDNIAMERVVGDSVIPTGLPRYNGSSDPMQHLLKFEHLMELHGHSSNIYAKVLVTTFQDLALEWFTRLEPRSISSYEQLTEKFLHQFARKKKIIIK